MKKKEILVSMLLMILLVRADVRENFIYDYVKGSDAFCGMDPADRFYGVSAFFFDFDGDGEEEALVSDYLENDPMGAGWKLVYRDRQAILKTGRILDVTRKEAILRVFARARLFYRADFAHGIRSFLGRQIAVAEYVADEPQILREVSCQHRDAVLTMNEQGRLVVHDLPNEVDDIVGNPGFEKLERAFWENYQGPEMKRVPWSGWYRGYKPIPAEQLRPLGGLVPPPGFDTFVKRYREEVKGRLNITNRVTVLAVFHDGDNDGDVDAYVSSSAERMEGERYKWHLYLNGKNGLLRAMRRISKRTNEFDDAVFIEPEEVVPRTAFHRVVRFGRQPLVVVLEMVGKRVHTRGFLKYVTEDERRTQPHVGAALYDKEKSQAYQDWRDEVDERLGYVHPLDLRELVDDFSFFRLERLPCKEFPEGETCQVPSSGGKGK